MRSLASFGKLARSRAEAEASVVFISQALLRQGVLRHSINSSEDLALEVEKGLCEYSVLVHFILRLISASLVSWCIEPHWLLGGSVDRWHEKRELLVFVIHCNSSLHQITFQFNYIIITTGGLTVGYVVSQLLLLHSLGPRPLLLQQPLLPHNTNPLLQAS